MANAMQTGVPGNLIASVPYKGNDKAVHFFNDHLEYKGQAVGYGDIADITIGRSYMTDWRVSLVMTTGYIGLTLAHGSRLSIKTGGFSLYGIGSASRSNKRFDPLCQAIYDIVAPVVAQRVLDEIGQGYTVEVGDLAVDENAAVRQKSLLISAVQIDRTNFGTCALNFSGGAYVEDKAGNLLYNGVMNQRNAIVLPYVLAALFGA